jgi:hypothetical protein
MANVHGGNLHHPDTEAIKGRCIRTNFHHYISRLNSENDINPLMMTLEYRSKFRSMKGI